MDISQDQTTGHPRCGLPEMSRVRGGEWGVKIDDAETYLRTITAGELDATGRWRWCEQWWRHDEAVTAHWYGLGHIPR